MQAAAGNVAAKSTFAYLQSAAMGGYGAPLVNGITSAGAGAFGAGVHFFNRTSCAIRSKL